MRIRFHDFADADLDEIWLECQRASGGRRHHFSGDLMSMLVAA